MGKSHFGECLADADPEDGTIPFFLHGCPAFHNQPGESQGKPRNGACIAYLPAMDFGQRSGGQATLQHVVQ
jgi:hypothetical protein